MSRLTDPEALMFPVKEQPIFVSRGAASGERWARVPGKKAIVNTVNGRVLDVVSQGCRLVTNREALALAHQCCRAVFPETKPGEWQVQAADAPATGGHCFIDLAHNQQDALRRDYTGDEVGLPEHGGGRQLCAPGAPGRGRFGWRLDHPRSRAGYVFDTKP